MIISFLVFRLCLFLVLGAYLLATHGSDAKRARLQKRLSEALLHSAHTEDMDVVLARNELMSEIPWVNRTLISIQAALAVEADVGPGRSAHHAVALADVFGHGRHAWRAGRVSADVHHSNDDSRRTCCCVRFRLSTFGGNARSASMQFLEHLPDALDLMSRALSAGHAFSEALHMVSTEMPEPIATEFRKTYEEQNLGLSLKLALENLTQRMPLLDLKMCVTAILIQRETGGNLAEILEKVAYTIRERFRIMGDLKTLTTSSRMSAWLLCALADLRGVRGHGNESGVHERAVERSARPLPDRSGHVHADHGNVDREEDFEDKDLRTLDLVLWS